MNNLQTQLSISVFMLVVFLIGLGAGTVGTNWLNSGPPIGRSFGPGGPRGPGGPGRPNPPIPFVNERLVERLSNSFDLTDDQNDRLEALLDSQQENFREFRREMGERFAHARDEFHAALSEILTVEQMQRFESEFVRMGGRPDAASPPRP